MARALVTKSSLARTKTAMIGVQPEIDPEASCQPGPARMTTVPRMSTLSAKGSRIRPTRLSTPQRRAKWPSKASVRAASRKAASPTQLKMGWGPMAQQPNVAAANGRRATVRALGMMFRGGNMVAEDTSTLLPAVDACPLGEYPEQSHVASWNSFIHPWRSRTGCPQPV